MIILEVLYYGKLTDSLQFAEVLNCLESLNVEEQNLNDIPKSALIYKDALFKFVLYCLAYSFAVLPLCFIVAGYSPLS